MTPKKREGRRPPAARACAKSPAERWIERALVRLQRMPPAGPRREERRGTLVAEAVGRAEALLSTSARRRAGSLRRPSAVSAANASVQRPAA